MSNQREEKESHCTGKPSVCCMLLGTMHGKDCMCKTTFGMDPWPSCNMHTYYTQTNKYVYKEIVALQLLPRKTKIILKFLYSSNSDSQYYSHKMGYVDHNFKIAYFGEADTVFVGCCTWMFKSEISTAARWAQAMNEWACRHPLLSWKGEVLSPEQRSNRYIDVWGLPHLVMDLSWP